MTRHQLQCFFLERLGRLVEQRAGADASWTVGEHLLIHYARYATYRDCGGVGLRKGRPGRSRGVAERHPV